MDQNGVLFFQNQDIFSKYFVFIFRIETNASSNGGLLLGFLCTANLCFLGLHVFRALNQSLYLYCI